MRRVPIVRCASLHRRRRAGPFVLLHRGNVGADAVHRVAPHVGEDLFARGVETLHAKFNRAGHFAALDVDGGLQRNESLVER